MTAETAILMMAAAAVVMSTGPATPPIPASLFSLPSPCPLYPHVPLLSVTAVAAVADALPPASATAAL